MGVEHSMDEEQVDRISVALRESAAAIQGINHKFDLVDEHYQRVQEHHQKVNAKIDDTLQSFARMDATLQMKTESMLDVVTYATDELSVALEGALTSLRRFDLKRETTQLPKIIIPLIIPLIVLLIELSVANAYLGILLASVEGVRDRYSKYLLSNASTVLLGLTGSLLWLGWYRVSLSRKSRHLDRIGRKLPGPPDEGRFSQDPGRSESTLEAELYRRHLDRDSRFGVEHADGTRSPGSLRHSLSPIDDARVSEELDGLSARRASRKSGLRDQWSEPQKQRQLSPVQQQPEDNGAESPSASKTARESSNVAARSSTMTDRMQDFLTSWADDDEDDEEPAARQVTTTSARLSRSGQLSHQDKLQIALEQRAESRARDSIRVARIERIRNRITAREDGSPRHAERSDSDPSITRATLRLEELGAAGRDGDSNSSDRSPSPPISPPRSPTYTLRQPPAVVGAQSTQRPARRGYAPAVTSFGLLGGPMTVEWRPKPAPDEAQVGSRSRAESGESQVSNSSSTAAAMQRQSPRSEFEI